MRNTRFQRHSRVLGATALGALLLASAPAGAEEAAAAPAAGPKAAPGLDRLLRLPDDLDYAVERRGGATRGEWRTRFREAREELGDARTALEKSKREIEGVAEDSEAWLLAPPGVSESNQAPLSYRLHQELKRNRAEVQRAERQLRDLEIEAELAGVPKQWRGEPARETAPAAAEAAEDLPASP